MAEQAGGRKVKKIQIRMERKLFLLPILSIGGVLGSSWYHFLLGNYVAETRHYLALVGFVLILLLYRARPFWGLIGTGIFIMLSLFNLLFLFTSVYRAWVSFTIAGKEMSTPSVDLRVLWVLLIFSVSNVRSLYRLFFEKGEGNASGIGGSR